VNSAWIYRTKYPIDIWYIGIHALLQIHGQSLLLLVLGFEVGGYRIGIIRFYFVDLGLLGLLCKVPADRDRYS